MRSLPLAVSLLALAACGPTTKITPDTVSSFGNVRVSVRGDELKPLKNTLTVSVGGTFAYLVQRDASDTVSFVVQGSPAAGPAEVVISDGRLVMQVGPLTYQPPKDPRLARLVAFGASLTEGAQSASISVHGQTHGLGAAVAKAAGSYLSLPLVHDDDMPGLLPSDFDMTTCQSKVDFDAVVEQRGIDSILPKISDDQNGIVIARVRIDPDLEVRNVAVGGLKLGQILRGANDLPLTIMEHITWDARASESQLFDEPKDTQLQRVVALQPTVLVSTDLFANDFVTLDLSGMGPPDVSTLTPLDSFAADLTSVLNALDQTGAEVFVANGPDCSFMKPYQDKVQALLAGGLSQDQATQWVSDLRTRIEAYNAELARQAPMHPHLHVVDFHAKVDDVIANGVPVAGHTLKPVPFGGLLSFDGQHFSDTGYAMTANLFVDSINAWLGSEAVPHLDLDAVYADDPYSIENLRAQGFSCAGTL